MKKEDNDMFPQNNVVGGLSSPKVRKKSSNLSNSNANTTKHGSDDEDRYVSSNDVADLPDSNTHDISNTVSSDDSSSDSKFDNINVEDKILSINNLDDNVAKNSNSAEDGVFENNSGNDTQETGSTDDTTDSDLNNDKNTDFDLENENNSDDNNNCDLNDCYYDNYSSSCNLDLAVLNEISKACQTAMNNISYLVKNICNDKMKKELVSMYSQYSNILFQTNQHFEKYGEVPDCVSIGCKVMGFCGIKMNTFKNKTSSHVADIMIQGTLLGVIKCQKILNCQLNIDESTTNLLKDFNKFQRDNIDKLNAYL